ncbi:DISARM system helicase DrmA [Actinoallomurus sp. NPDC052308]|uniref:DISARM system helicase DrmA n=1 Tax=Actinoallomurus sp. NPDC052308 TaxID=3155530 RepID=UPI003445F351
MSERDILVEALVAEVLGPRRGPTESMPAEEDPLDEYIVGVLAPAMAASVEDDAEQELVGDVDPHADDDSDLGSAVPISPTTPAGLPSLTLDPMSRPASMGISLCVRAVSTPVLDICCTWARYQKTEDGSWLRKPHRGLWRQIACAQEPTLADSSDPAVRLKVRSRLDSMGNWLISLFLVNETQSLSDRPTAEEHVYQPQIRVRLRDGSEIVPVEQDRPSEDPEEQGLALLYKDRPVLARGHLCSAVWKAIDPERPHPAGLKGFAAPFVWSDGHHLFDVDTVAEFEPADVRSEFVPVVPVNAPGKAWPLGAGKEPELDPSNLAELADGAALRIALAPLADGYERWINRIEEEAGYPANGSAEHRHISGCRLTLGRIRDGIDLLATDTDARMAFCFSNRAIALQSTWTKGRVNPWWPFQLAFQLVNLRAMTDPAHPDREVCDLLWFPTGGGKTEAYLGLAAFTLARRRLAAARENRTDGGAGVTVLSRYTLRLLTIQQYRRALALVTACEFLRVAGPRGRRGWRPESWKNGGDLPWGTHRFSIGLWVGGNVTPNNLQDFKYRDSSGRFVDVYGAISILDGKKGEGEPAQVLNCPACQAILAMPADGLRNGDTDVLHLVVGDADPTLSDVTAIQLSREPLEVTSVTVTPHADPTYATVSVALKASEDMTADQIDKWFVEHARRQLGGAYLAPTLGRATRPGYFVRSAAWGNSEKDLDFEILCPNPHCELNTDLVWSETTQIGDWPVHEAFDRGDGSSTHCPIPAWTVDEQVYARCPSMVVSTVDKFARLAYEPRAGALFGNVDRLNEHLGYFRSWAPPTGPGSLPTKPRMDPAKGTTVAVQAFLPPELILQDELHLIEGPLGSMVGLYETGIDLLATTHTTGSMVRPKYIASTATVRQAGEQVQSLFARSLQVFPPQGLRAEQSFFSWSQPAHPLDTQGPGRLYVGLVAPGRGAQTPLVRAWSRLLQEPYDRRAAGADPADLDPFWTLVGYFNAIRELAGAVALVRQDIVQRLDSIATTGAAGRPRELTQHDPMELSSRADSLFLPTMLDDLGASLPSDREPVNAVTATSMFGTGVDVDRLGLMFVNGQPKTTSSYIQATGRVGRSKGGLIVAFYRASRPRDLSHYEYFAGYHSTLYRHVEPVTVNPFAPRARDRGLGPVAVSILRQAAHLPGPNGPVPVDDRWRVQQRLTNSAWQCRADEMSIARTDPDVELLPELLEQRASHQPVMRRPAHNETAAHTISELDRWQQLAAQSQGRLLYNEPTVTRTASRPVVLGDLAHHVAGTGQAYDNAPNSLREVESTTSIQGRG